MGCVVFQDVLLDSILRNLGALGHLLYLVQYKIVLAIRGLVLPQT